MEGMKREISRIKESNEMRKEPNNEKHELRKKPNGRHENIRLNCIFF